MLIKITAKRQVTFPAHVLDALGVRPGDQLELQQGPDGFILRPRRIDPSRLAPLRDRLRRGQGQFAIETFRDEPHDPALRD
jgi:AbrB family looped-hinge helix DNA binding protein